MAGYSLDNAIFLWEEGERTLRDADEAHRRRLERAVAAIVDELRRRLGSAYTLAELADLYGAGTDWASELVDAGGDSSAVLGAAFARYARGAADYTATHPGWRR